MQRTSEQNTGLARGSTSDLLGEFKLARFSQICMAGRRRYVIMAEAAEALPLAAQAILQVTSRLGSPAALCGSRKPELLVATQAETQSTIAAHLLAVMCQGVRRLQILKVPTLARRPVNARCMCECIPTHATALGRVMWRGPRDLVDFVV